MSDTFSVYWHPLYGSRICEMRQASAEDAMGAVRRLTSRPSSFVVKDVMVITEADDTVCFHWNRDKGIIFPAKEDL